MINQIKNKKAVSIMIGYVLLITFAIVIAIFVYQWLKTYVPKEGLECPEGVSIYIPEKSINGNKNLELVLANNGKFNISGFYIYYSKEESQQIANNSLSNNIDINSNFIKVGLEIKILGSGSIQQDNPFAPDTNKTIEIKTDNINGRIYSIEITPTRVQEKKNKKQVVSCTNAKTKKIINETFPISL